MISGFTQIYLHLKNVFVYTVNRKKERKEGKQRSKIFLPTTVYGINFDRK